MIGGLHLVNLNFKYMKIIQKIWDFLKNPENQRLILIIGIVIFILFFLKQCDKINNLDDKNKVLKQNEKHYKDTLEIVKNKNNELQYERAVLLTTKKKLKRDSTLLAEELLKQKGKVIYLNKIIASLKGEIVIVNDTVFIVRYPNGIKGINWKYDKIYDDFNYLSLSGESKVKIINEDSLKPEETKINYDLGFDLITGLKEENGYLKIFAKSNNENIKITKLDGALIDPKKSKVLKSVMPKYKWIIGPTFSTGIMYNPLNKNMGPYVGLGIGISRRISFQDMKNIFK